MKVIKISLNLDFFLVEKINVRVRDLKSLELNSNKFILDTLYYTSNFVKWNKEDIKSYLSSKDVSTVFYKDFDSFFLMSDLILVSDIRFDVKKSLSVKVLDKLLDNDNLRSLSCYFIPSDYIHDFSIKNVSVKFINDMSFTPEFVSSNKLSNLLSLYYKKVISFNSESEVDDNLEHFLKINQNLRLIHLYFYSNKSITFITEILDRFNLKEVDIFIHQSESNLADISTGSSFLRKVNKRYSNSFREIKIVYSDKFFRDNIFRELTINGIKLCMIAVFYVGIIFVISDKYQEYVTLLNLRLLEESLGEVIPDLGDVDEMDDTEVNVPEEIPNEEESPTEEVESPKVYVNHYANIPTSFDKLKSINSEVKGWISVNNTKINYPFTQHSDNKYYLDYDIYKRKVITGWIFMDYRNDSNFQDQNTIIYGHNTTSGYMFGDLKNTANKSWYMNPDNQIITVKTLDKEMYFKIFSIYKTDYTTDYLNTGFYNEDYFNEFINLIKSRSIHDFNVNIEPDDKILTLSSCTGGNNRRIVVHALLLD